MKSAIHILLFGIIFNFGIMLLPQRTFSQGTTVSVQVFYDELSPYGTWVNNPEYGYVWYPNEGAGFSPYSSNGYWAYTDYGWTWVSGYSWGWAPFHYGRWYHDPNYGPMWVPGSEWGPGWVTWRRSSGYYGWAPIGPGISINVAYGSGYNVPNNQWRFVRDRDFGRTNINNYYVNNSNNVTIINNSTVINNSREDHNRNVTYNSGPERTEVEKHSGRKISEIPVKESGRPGQNVSNDRIEVYKPNVEKGKPTGAGPAPAKVQEMKGSQPQNKASGTSPSKNESQAVKQGGSHQTQNKPNTNQNAKPAGTQSPSHQAKPVPNSGVPKQQEPKSSPVNPKTTQPVQRPPQTEPQHNQQTAPQTQPRKTEPAHQSRPQQNQPGSQAKPQQPQRTSQPKPQHNPGGQKQSQPGKPKH